jgi:cobalt-zinc-cadmium efflux system outer membrane protein
MDFKDGIVLVMVVLISSSAAKRVEGASPEPLTIRTRATSQQSGALSIEGVEEPRGVMNLRQVLEVTLLRNPELAAFSFEMRAAEARALQAGVLPNPQVGVELENFGGTGSTTKGVRAIETTLQLSQLIELGGKRAKRLRLAGFERELMRWDYEVKRLEVLTEAKKAFVDVLATGRRLDFTADLLRLAEHVQRTVAARVRAGKVSPIEETRTRVAVSTARLQVQQARSSHAAAKKRLAASWGSTAPVFEGVHGSLDTTAPVPFLELLTVRMQMNPDIARWTSEMEARRAQVELARSKAVPDLTVSGGVRYLNEPKEGAFVLGFSLPLPLFDRNQGGIQEAYARLSKAELERRAAEVRVGTALSDVYQHLVSAANEVTTLQNDVLPAAEEAFQATEEGYRLGKFALLDVLDVQRTLFENRGRYLEALAAYHKAVADLERFSGEELDAVPAGATRPREKQE